MKRNLAPLLLGTALVGCVSGSTIPRQPVVVHDRPVIHAAELLRNHPGVRLVGSAGEMKLFIRGALNEPLVIVDGMAVMPDSRGVLGSINPLDIAQIKVLSDPTDLTFYGARGGNGVVVITTKKGVIVRNRRGNRSISAK